MAERERESERTRVRVRVFSTSTQPGWRRIAAQCSSNGAALRRDDAAAPCATDRPISGTRERRLSFGEAQTNGGPAPFSARVPESSPRRAASSRGSCLATAARLNSESSDLGLGRESARELHTMTVINANTFRVCSMKVLECLTRLGGFPVGIFGISCDRSKVIRAYRRVSPWRTCIPASSPTSSAANFRPIRSTGEIARGR